MVRLTNFFWILIYPVVVCSFCFKKLAYESPEAFKFMSNNITMLELDDMEPAVFSRINHAHGRCLKNILEYRNGRLKVTLHCELEAIRFKKDIFWNTSVMTVELDIIRVGSVIHGYSLFLCDSLKQTSGVLIVNNANAQLVQEGNTRLMTYDQDCQCDYMITINIDYLDHMSTIGVNATEEPKHGLPKHYKIAVAALMMIVILLLCIGCSYF